MSTTAYSVDRCQGSYDYSSGTTYYYSTTKSPHDRLTTRPCSEAVALHPILSHVRMRAPETHCRHISLANSMFTQSPRKREQRRPLGDYIGATHHPYHTTRRLTPPASAPFVVSLRACATLRLAQAPSSYLHTTLPANTNQFTLNTNRL